MRYIGFRRDGAVQVGALAEDGTVTAVGEVNEFWKDPFAATRRAADGAALPALRLDSLDLVPPVRPSARVLCVGLNYAKHVDEGPFDPPEYPTVFARWTASLAVADTPVAVPPGEAGLDWEGELVAAVGRPLSQAEEGEAFGAVFAYAAFNDITARRAQKLTTQWTIGKNADNSGPLSPFVTADEVGDPAQGLRVRTTVNGETVQDGTTSDMVFGVGTLLSFLSRCFTLQPGDLVATGTPNGVGYARTPPWLLNAGDVVTVDIEKVGSVRTPVIAGPAAAGIR
jgi:2-keto-4-pentenoate hydratase/2-oxohepta-3-ene-1,7-dioic acid hydratase in catechol pathway